jgi:hypothetical protein
MRKLIVNDQITQILSYNPKRIAVIIFNIGNADIWVNEDPSDPLENGIPIPAGGCLVLKKSENDPAEMPLWGRCDSTLSTELRIWEIYAKS